ncbi:terminase [Salmonella enterica subsp. enterica serovar Corvallis]|nr:terminase [Salmonella enterica subsp. enterica serovar Corvallis]
MARRSTIDKLPEDVRRWLERALTGSGFSGYAELEALMRDKGYLISKSAIHRYGQKIERRFGAIRAATEAARMLTEGAADDQDARSEAVIALIQTELFESIVQLQEAEDEEIDPQVRVALLSKVAKNVATLSRASVNLKKFQQDLREKIAAKMDALEAESKSGSGRIDAETLKRVREEIYGIVK